MGTLVVSHKDTDDLLQVQSGVTDGTNPVLMATAYIEMLGKKIDDYNCQIDSTIDLTKNEFIKVMAVVGGIIVDKPPTLDEEKGKRLLGVSAGYESVCNGKDPATGKQIYVDCVVGETTYRMNAGKEAAKSMDEGVRIYERAGATHMPVVRDFYNTNHENIPLDEAISISLQQGADALTYWQRKGELVDQINAATTVEDVQAIEISFTVNTE